MTPRFNIENLWRDKKTIGLIASENIYYKENQPSIRIDLAQIHKFSLELLE